MCKQAHNPTLNTLDFPHINTEIKRPFIPECIPTASVDNLTHLLLIRTQDLLLETCPVLLTLNMHSIHSQLFVFPSPQLHTVMTYNPTLQCHPEEDWFLFEFGSSQVDRHLRSFSVFLSPLSCSLGI